MSSQQFSSLEMALAAHSDFTLLLSEVSPGSSPGGSLPLVYMYPPRLPATGPYCAEWPDGLLEDKNSFVLGSKSPLLG